MLDLVKIGMHSIFVDITISLLLFANVIPRQTTCRKLTALNSIDCTYHVYIFVS